MEVTYRDIFIGLGAFLCGFAGLPALSMALHPELAVLFWPMAVFFAIGAAATAFGLRCKH